MYLKQFDGHTTMPWEACQQRVAQEMGRADGWFIQGPATHTFCGTLYFSNRADAHLMADAPKLLADLAAARARLAELEARPIDAVLAWCEKNEAEFVVGGYIPRPSGAKEWIATVSDFKKEDDRFGSSFCAHGPTQSDAIAALADKLKGE